MASSPSVWSQLTTPISFNHRYNLKEAIPAKIGSLFLGYSEGSIQVYLKRTIGDNGMIIWDLASFITTIRNAVSKRSFTPDLVALIQELSNELMPGLNFDIPKFQCFLRPHVEGTRLGFMLRLETWFNAAELHSSGLKNLFENFSKDILPMFTFVVRGFNIDSLSFGDINVAMFFIFETDSTVFVEFDITFLFNKAKLSAQTADMIENISDANNGAATEMKDDDTGRDTRTVRDAQSPANGIGGDAADAADLVAAAGTSLNKNGGVGLIGTGADGMQRKQNNGMKNDMQIVGKNGFWKGAVLSQFKLIALTAIGLGMTTVLNGSKMKTRALMSSL